MADGKERPRGTRDESDDKDLRGSAGRSGRMKERVIFMRVAGPLLIGFSVV